MLHRPHLFKFFRRKKQFSLLVLFFFFSKAFSQSNLILTLVENHFVTLDHQLRIPLIHRGLPVLVAMLLRQNPSLLNPDCNLNWSHTPNQNRFRLGQVSDWAVLPNWHSMRHVVESRAIVERNHYVSIDFFMVLIFFKVSQIKWN